MKEHTLLFGLEWALNFEYNSTCRLYATYVVYVVKSSSMYWNANW